MRYLQYAVGFHDFQSTILNSPSMEVGAGQRFGGLCERRRTGRIPAVFMTYVQDWSRLGPQIFWGTHKGVVARDGAHETPAPLATPTNLSSATDPTRRIIRL